MDPVNLIGLIGHAQNGKTTAANRLAEMNWNIVSFASPLKEMLATLGVPVENLYGKHKEAPLPMLCGMTARHAMQTLGTEWGRNLIGPDIWRMAWRSKVKTMLGAGAMVVADDVRFPNEVETIKEMGGLVIRIVRAPRSSFDTHGSEAEIAGLQEDRTITNFGTVDGLRNRISCYGNGLVR